MIIREAQNTDFAQLLKLGEDLHLESEYRDLEFNAMKCLNMFNHMLSGATYKIFICEDKTGLCGMMACECYAPYFSHEMVAGEHLIYVKPEKRNTRAFYKLVNVFLEWALSKDVKMLYLKTSSGINSDKIDKMYKKLGFARVGGIYRRKN